MGEPVERLLARWIAAGLLDEGAAARIRAFEAALSSTSRVRWPLRLALGFGAVAVGAGLLLFVSARWETLSPGARFGLVLTLVGALHVSGAWLTERFHTMAVTLHALGTVALGAGIYLLGRVFNLEEHWPNGLLLWSTGASLAWAFLRSWPQLLLTAVLAPAWLVGEWMLVTEGLNSSVVTDVMASGTTLLALAYDTAVHGERREMWRSVLARLGGAALPIALGTTALAASEAPSMASMPTALALIGWTAALGIPLVVGASLRGRHAWPLLVAAAWLVTALQIHDAGPIALYAWFGLGAIGLTAWGVSEDRVERINFGAALFAATVITFYFSEVMDRLGRAGSLIGLGLVFLAGGWALERLRRRLVEQARGGAGP